MSIRTSKRELPIKFSKMNVLTQRLKPQQSIRAHWSLSHHARTSLSLKRLESVSAEAENWLSTLVHRRVW